MRSVVIDKNKSPIVSNHTIRLVLIPTAALILMVAITLVGWDLVRKDQNRQLLIDTVGATEQTAARIESFISTRLSMGDHLRHVWLDQQIQSETEFRFQAQSIHSLFPDIQAINWVSADKVIRWVTPLAGNEKAIGLDLDRLKVPRAMLSEAIRTGELQTSPIIELAQGNTGFVTYIPIVDGSFLQGFLNIVFKIEPLLEAALVDDTNKRFVFQFSDQGKLVVETGPFQDAENIPVVKRAFTVGSRVWQVTGQPALVEIKSQYSFLDELALGAGLFLSLVITALVGLVIHRQHMLNISEEKFRSIFEQVATGIVIFDFDGKLVQANEAFLDMLGYRADELKGHTFSGISHPDDVEIGRNASQSLFEDPDHVLEIEKRYLHKDGRTVHCEITSAALKDNEGKPYLVSAQFQDMTKRKDDEKTIMNAMARAEQANRAKSEFLASMSHDLRTPLNAILGFSEMMTTKVFGPTGHPKYEEYAELIFKSGGRLISMVNDILDISKIESNEYTLDDRFVDVQDALLAVKERCAIQPSDRAEGRINVLLKNDLPRLYCDERALSQILDNLLTNALKYSVDTDQIFLSFVVNQKGEGIITVEDTGQGIPKENLKEIIQPFVQAVQSNQSHPHISKKQDGIGLGLHIVSRLVSLHEAELVVDSELGIGTKITIIFSSERLEKML